MDECVLRVRAPDGGARGWRSTLFGIAIGLGVGIAGKRMLPPVSEPSVANASPAAAATPEPDDDEPAHAPASQGLTGTCRPGANLWL